MRPVDQGLHNQQAAKIDGAAIFLDTDDRQIDQHAGHYRDRQAAHTEEVYPGIDDGLGAANWLAGFAAVHCGDRLSRLLLGLGVRQWVTRAEAVSESWSVPGSAKLYPAAPGKQKRFHRSNKKARVKARAVGYMVIGRFADHLPIGRSQAC
jgi:hypothetical protein